MIDIPLVFFITNNKDSCRFVKCFLIFYNTIFYLYIKNYSYKYKQKNGVNVYRSQLMCMNIFKCIV